MFVSRIKREKVYPMPFDIDDIKDQAADALKNVDVDDLKDKAEDLLKDVDLDDLKDKAKDLLG